jgi:membrane AbrB-like protein
MLPTFPSTRAIMNYAETLLIALLGGVAFVLIGFPAGLVSGSMIAAASAALLGRPMKIPLLMARASFVLIGVMLGAVVTPATLQGMGTWPASVALLGLSSVLMIVATTYYLRRVHGWDPLSALLGASPGSMAQSLALSAEFGANMRGIAIVQTMRVLLITIGLPGGLALFGLVAPSMPTTAAAGANASIIEIGIMLVICSVVAALVNWIRFPGGLLFGAMMASAVLHGADILHASLPWWLGSFSVLVLGGLVGSRFANTSPALLVEYFWAALGSSAVALGVAFCFVLLVTTSLPFRIADVVIAFAPGAQDTMMVLALALHLDPVYVGAHHVMRFVIVTLTIAMAARYLARQYGVKSKGEVPARTGKTTIED